MIDWLTDPAGSAQAAVAGAVTDLLGELVYWVLTGAINVADMVYRQLNTEYAIDVGDVADVYDATLLAAGVLVVGAIWLAIGMAVLHANPGMALRRLLVDAPKFVLVGAVTLTITGTVIGAVEELNGFLIAEVTLGRPDALFEGLRPLADQARDGGLVASVLVPFVSLLIIAVSLYLYVFLMIRKAAVLMLVAVAPLVAVTLVTPYAPAYRKLVETLFALLVAKTAMILMLLVGSAVLVSAPDGAVAAPPPVPSGFAATAGAADPAAGAGVEQGVVGTLMAGFVVLVLTAFSPWLVFHLMPNLDGAANAGPVAQGGVTADARSHAGLRAVGRRMPGARRRAGGGS